MSSEKSANAGAVLPSIVDKVTAVAGGFRQMTTPVDVEKAPEEAAALRRQFSTLPDAAEVVEVVKGRLVLTIWRPWKATRYRMENREAKMDRGVTRGVNRGICRRKY